MTDSFKKNIMAMAMAMAMLIASLATTGSAQQIAACATKLVPCAPYLNSTSPPQSCCGPLKDALIHDLACLCSIFEHPEILKSFNINLNLVLQMPKHCGVSSFSVNSSCNISPAGAPAASPPTPAGAPAASPPTPAGAPAASPPTPAGAPAAFPLPPATPGGNNINAARTAAWFGWSSLISLFLFWWSVMA